MTPDGVVIHTDRTTADENAGDPSFHAKSTINWDSTTKMFYGSIRDPEAAFGSEGDRNAHMGVTAHEFESLFGVIRRVTDGDTATEGDQSEVWVDLDGPPPPSAAAGTNKDPVNIHGFKRVKGEIVGPTGVDVSADHKAAFTRYEKYYNLGADEAVGGAPGATATAPDNTDSIKVASNAVAAVPAVASDSEFAFGMSFNAGGVTIGVGYDSNKTVNMGAGFTTGEITTNLLYVKTEDNEDTKMVDEEMTGMGVDMAYAMGASTVTLSYGRRKPEEGEAMDAVGMGVTHDLGGGATLNAGFGKVDKDIGTAASPMIVAENKASIGLMFKF